MASLDRLPASQVIAVMQSINVVVLNRSFLGAFMGTAAISLLAGILALPRSETPSAPWFLAGALLYLEGTLLVTGLGNLPLNRRLATVTADDAAAMAAWEHYLDRWTFLNTVRTVAAIAAALSFAIALVQNPG